MAMREEDADSANAAYEAFHIRHRTWLFSTVKARYGWQIGADEEVGEVVHLALINAFRGAATFKGTQDANPEKSRLEAKRWVVGIARNAVRDRLRGRNRPEEPLPEDFEEIFASPDVDDLPEPEDLKRVNEAIDDLDEREQDVIRTTWLYHKPGEEHQRLPDDVCAELAQRTGLTSPHIRTIRMRANRKIYKSLGVSPPDTGRKK